MTQPSAAPAQFTAFWLYSRRDNWRESVHPNWHTAVSEFSNVLSESDVTIRGAYTTMGLRPDVDMMLWVHAEKLDQIRNLAVQIDQTEIGRALHRADGYIGTAEMSQYDPTHGPAFVKGDAPRRYLSVYPFIKTPEWYLIDYKERRDMMVEHGRLADPWPNLQTNTVESFGIQDQEFIVALEDDSPKDLVDMVKKLREAEVRVYTSVDTPIYLGELMSVEDTLETIKG